MPARPSPLRNVLALSFLASLSACGSCKREDEGQKIVIIDDGGPPARTLRRPFDRHHRDAGIPLLPSMTAMPHPSASTGAPAAPIE